jgi:AraC family transcriptional regulator
MICIHDNWARHDRPGEYPELHRYFHTGYSIFYGRAVKTRYDKHTDAPFTFKTTLKGEEIYHYDNVASAVNPGRYLLLNRGQEYSCEVEHPEKVQSLSIFFGTHVFNNVLSCLKEKDEVLLENIGLWKEQPIYFFEKLYQYSPRLLYLRTRLVALLDDRTGNRMELGDLLYHLLTELLLHHNLEKAMLDKIKVKKPSTQRECHKRLCYALDYLHSNYRSNSIDLDTLAEVAKLSPAHLSKLFKEVYLTSPYQYLKNIRLEKACDLLSGTSLPVNEVARSVGYEDCSAFIRSFKKKYGYTPEEYRLMC